MRTTRQPVIAIDGPAASGKSSVARAIANHFGMAFVSSGMLYRAVTWLALRDNPESLAPVSLLIPQLESGALLCELENRSLVLKCGAQRLQESVLTTPLINRYVSECSAEAQVRAWCLQQFRRFATEAPLVMEGRDIGSVVFPDTPYKFYLDADLEVRARRRIAQGIGDAIASRDLKDSSREHAPLTIAPDAVIIDNSKLDLLQTVQLVLAELQRREFHL